MKRLLNSSKFWSAVIGSVFSVIAFQITNEVNLSYLILGAFIGNIAGTSVEDALDKINRNKKETEKN